MYKTDMYEGMLAETLVIPGANGDLIHAYMARPLGPGPHPGMVVIHHMPGWDEWYREATRRYAHHGYVALSPNLYDRAGHGTPRAGESPHNTPGYAGTPTGEDMGKGSRHPVHRREG